MKKLLNTHENAQVQNQHDDEDYVCMSIWQPLAVAYHSGVTYTV